MKKAPRHHTLRLDKIVGGGQALGTLDDARRAFVWGGLPGETVIIRETKRKSNFLEGVVTEVIEASPERIKPLDPESYLSTSPWQIMTSEAEQRYKAALIEEAFELHGITLPGETEVYSDNYTEHYRNKVEFSWYGAAIPRGYGVGGREYGVAASEASREIVSSERHLQPEYVPMDARDRPGAKPSDDEMTSDEGDSSGAKPLKRETEVSASGYEEKDGGGERDDANETLDLAFFRRGSKGKIAVDSMSLLPEPMMSLARKIRNDLHAKNVTARQLKTLLIRCDQSGNCVWQLYVKDKDFDAISEQDAIGYGAQGGEVIYSDPRSPASRITERLLAVGDIVLSDTILGVPFRYATEGFFQVNIPVYEEALRDMREATSLQNDEWRMTNNVDRAISSNRHTEEHSDFPSEVGQDQKQIAIRPYALGMMGGDDSEAQDFHKKPVEQPSGNMPPSVVQSTSTPIIDLYSGVGSIGLTIGGDDCTLIEIDENAVREMKRNITELGSNAHAVLAPAEKALDYINGDSIVIVDPPRAGMHAEVVAKLLEAQPPRIIYLSCNPVTQARDVSLLSEKYRIVSHRGYNFFPRTPHVEHLVVLDKR